MGKTLNQDRTCTIAEQARTNALVNETFTLAVTLTRLPELLTCLPEIDPALIVSGKNRTFSEFLSIKGDAFVPRAWSLDTILVMLVEDLRSELDCLG